MRKLPTVVIGGWLGAGKTTLVNRLLRLARGRRVAVLVNDFGDIGIDADLIEGQASAGVLSLAGGCLCCSFGDDLVGTLDVLARRDPAPEAVLIELSGVALPAAVVSTIGLSRTADLVCTLVLADAADVRQRAADRYVGDTVRRQLADADWLWQSKPDLVDAETLADTSAWLAALAPRARVWSGAVDTVWPELLLGWRDDAAAPAVAATPAPRTLAEAARERHPPFVAHQAGLRADVDLAALGARLASPASGVLRAKALLPGPPGTPGRVLQVAAGRWAIDERPLQGDGRIVLVGLRGRFDPGSLLA